MAHPHAVHFYQDESALVDRIVAYANAGLKAGGSALVISRAPFLGQFKARWLPLFQDRFVGLDAAKTLSSFMLGGRPDRQRFMETVGELVAQAANLSPHVYAFGEMVGLLWEEKNYDAALQLEEFWNELGTRYPLTLLCAYSAGAFSTAEDPGRLKVCGTHSHIVSHNDPLSTPVP